MLTSAQSIDAHIAVCAFLDIVVEVMSMRSGFAQLFVLFRRYIVVLINAAVRKFDFERLRLHAVAD